MNPGMFEIPTGPKPAVEIAQGVTCLFSADVTGVAFADFQLDPAYDEFKLSLIGVNLSTPSVLGVQVSTNGGVSWLFSYQYVLLQSTPDPSPTVTPEGSTSIIRTPLHRTSQSMGASSNYEGSIGIFGSSLPSAPTSFTIHSSYGPSSGGPRNLVIGQGYADSTAVINAIRIAPAVGGLASGLVKLYGFRKSP